MTDLIAAANDLLSAFKRQAPSYAQTQPAEMAYGEFADASIRDFGKWEVPADAEDDGDYDWQVPTAETGARAAQIVAEVQARHPGLKLSFAVEEKNWLTLRARKA